MWKMRWELPAAECHCECPASLPGTADIYIYIYTHTHTYKCILSWKICIMSQIRYNLHMNLCRKWVSEKYLSYQHDFTVMRCGGGCAFLLLIPVFRQLFLVLCYPLRSSQILWHPVPPRCSLISAFHYIAAHWRFCHACTAIIPTRRWFPEPGGEFAANSSLQVSARRRDTLSLPGFQLIVWNAQLGLKSLDFFPSLVIICKSAFDLIRAEPT